MADFDTFTPDSDPYGVFTEDNGNTDYTDYPGLDSDTSNWTPIALPNGSFIYEDNGSYVDRNGYAVSPDGSFLYTPEEQALIDAQIKAENQLGGVPGSSAIGGVTIPQMNIPATGGGTTTTTPTTPTTPTTTPKPSVLDQVIGGVKNTFTNPDGTLNLAKLLQAGGGALGGLAGLLGANKPTITPSGYQGGIPQLTAVRTALPQPIRTPYSGKPSMGTRYFSDIQYVNPADAPAVAAAQQQGAQQIANMYPVKAAQGGLMAAKGTYLRGSTDGMADELNTSIEGKQPAKLSHGEFVVPADVVSHLGNGNSDAGAKKLYQMMDRIRVARTGTKQQGKEINPDKFMPGGKVGYAEGGLAKFVAGGSTSNVPSGTALSSGLTGSEQSLSNWAAPYVTNMLGQGQAAANQPYQAYGGQLTAGVSPLQQQAFQGAQGLATPTNMGGFTPQSFTSQGTAQQYMNPYLQQALDPQLAEARRQSQITQTQNAGKLTGAGAYGGGRQAIMDAETQRNLATNLADITGRGYMNAYDKAMQQFNTEQQTAQQAQNLTNQYGLNVLGQQAGLGQTQRGIEAEDVAAQRAQFEEERLNPYKMVQFQSSLLGGLPLAAQTYNTAQPSWLQSLGQGAVFGNNSMNAILETLGIIPPTTK